LMVLWALILTAAAVHLAWMNRPELVVGATFVGLGLVAGLCVPGVWIHAGAAAAVLLLAGGALYTVGAFCYHRRWPNPYPAVLATTRSSTPTFAPPPPASTSPSACLS